MCATLANNDHDTVPQVSVFSLQSIHFYLHLDNVKIRFKVHLFGFGSFHTLLSQVHDLTF